MVRSGKTLQEQHIPANQFRGTGVIVRRPFPVSLSRKRASYIATAPVMGLILEAKGDTMTTALRALANGISEQYWVLRRIPRGLRSDFQLKLLKRMRRYIKESDLGGFVAT